MAEPSTRRIPGGVPSAHVDTFARDALPPAELWPVMDYGGIPELAYPDRVNCATELLDRAIARGWGDRVAFRAPGITWTYAELLARSNQVAHVLVDDLGLVAGNRVLLRGANSPMLVALWFAVLKAGGIVVCTMPLNRARELVFIADKAHVSLAVTDTRVAADCMQAMAQHADGRTRQGARVLEYHAPDGGSNGPSLEQLMRGKPTTFANVDTAANDVALIAFTSGTTGEGKGTMHFHRDVLAICDCFPTHVLQASPDDVFIGSPPLAFTFGLGGIVLFPMRIGASAVLLEQATPPFLIQAIQDYGATTVFTAPTAYRAMLGMRNDFDLSSLRRCVSAGEALPLATFTAWKEATGITIIDGIGATEMLHIFISASGDDVRPGATGKVVPGYEARVVDDDMRELPDGTIGRLAVRGPTGCRYLLNLERQRAYVRDGWNLTGDSYVRDADGYFWYQARTDDMIISSGYNISGPEVEGVLLEHLAVQECAVIGVPDEERGHIVKACVVLKPGFEASPAMVRKLQEWVKGQLAPYKYPRAIEFVDSMPRTATGKLQRFVLRDRARAAAPAAAAPPSPAMVPPAFPSAARPVGGAPPPPPPPSLAPSPSPSPVIVPGWPRPRGYADGMSARGRVVVTAGQIGWNPVTLQFESDDFIAQCAQAMRNLMTVLGAAGATAGDLVRLTWYITSRDEYAAAAAEVGRLYREVVGRHFPAMSVVVVAGLVEPRAKVEIEATAVVPE